MEAKRQICCLPGVDSSRGASSPVLMLPFSVLGLYFFIFGPLLIKKEKSLLICPSFHRSFHPYLMTNASFSFPVPTIQQGGRVDGCSYSLTTPSWPPLVL